MTLNGLSYLYKNKPIFWPNPVKKLQKKQANIKAII